MSSDGAWLLVRSDRLIVSVATPGVKYYIGRSRQLPAAQQLASKYVSNEHLCVVLSADRTRLSVYQVGKNPTFCGTPCLRLRHVADVTEEATPSLQVTVARDGQDTEEEPVAPPSAGGPATVRVTPRPVGAATAAPAGTDTSGAILYFPDELGLPKIAIRYEAGASDHTLHSTAANASKASLTVPQMLSVPSPAALLDDEDDDVNERTAGSGSEVKPQWQGLLDVALQQQQQRDTPRPSATSDTAVENVDTNSSTNGTGVSRKRSRTPPQSDDTTTPAAPVLPAEPVKAAKVELAGKPRSTQVPPSASSTPKMGFWEWKCRADGKNSDPKSWCKYPLAVAEILEEAYRAKKATVDVPDRILLNDATAPENKCTYAVCFNEASLDEMIQYQKEDHSRFRLIRRKGGDDVDRHGVKRTRIIPSSSDSESELDSDSSESSITSDTDSDS